MTPSSDSKTDYTLRLAAEGRGVVLAFRREDDPDSFVIKFPEIDPDQVYTLIFSDENLDEVQTTISGKALSDGLCVTID